VSRCRWAGGEGGERVVLGGLAERETVADRSPRLELVPTNAPRSAPQAESTRLADKAATISSEQRAALLEERYSALMSPVLLILERNLRR